MSQGHNLYVMNFNVQLQLTSTSKFWVLTKFQGLDSSGGARKLVSNKLLKTTSMGRITFPQVWKSAASCFEWSEDIQEIGKLAGLNEHSWFRKEFFFARSYFRVVIIFAVTKMVHIFAPTKKMRKYEDAKSWIAKMKSALKNGRLQYTK